MNEGNVVDISYEFFQFIRSSQLQDKWILEILRLTNGSNSYEFHKEKFIEIKLFNITRVLTQINLFIHSGSVYKYKFLEYLQRYYSDAVKIKGLNINKENKFTISELIEIEKYTYSQLVKFLFHSNLDKDELFYRFARQWMVQLIKQENYEGALNSEEMLTIFLNETIELSNKEAEITFSEMLSVYYTTKEESDIPEELKLLHIQKKVKDQKTSANKGQIVNREDIFCN